MKKAVFNKGEVVFREGDMVNCFYQIEKGEAGVYVSYGNADQRKLTEMKPGQFFGEMAVIEAWPRSSTIVAESDLHVIEIGENELNAYFTEQPDKILALMKQLGNRIREMTTEYDQVKSFLEGGKLPEGEKKEGFLAKLRKYVELNAMSNKNAGATQEDMLMMQRFGKLEKDDTVVLEFKRGDIIFREGDTGNFMYAIYGGSVGIYVNYGTAQENKLTQLYSDAFFGEMGLIGEEKRSATAVVEEDGTVLECIREEDLEALFKSNPVKIDMILSHLSHRLRRLTLDYVEACREAVEKA